MHSQLAARRHLSLFSKEDLGVESSIPEMPKNAVNAANVNYVQMKKDFTQKKFTPNKRKKFSTINIRSNTLTFKAIFKNATQRQTGTTCTLKLTPVLNISTFFDKSPDKRNVIEGPPTKVTCELGSQVKLSCLKKKKIILLQQEGGGRKATITTNLS